MTIEDFGGARVMGKDPKLSQEVTDYSKPIGEINLWLLGKKISNDGMHLEDDTSMIPIMNKEGAKAYCSWLESITAKPVTLSKQKHNPIATRLLLNCLTIRETLMTNAEEWELDFDKYSNMLVDIQDTLGTAAASGSIDGFTLQKLTENLNINEDRGGEAKKGWSLGSIFRRGGNNE